MTENEKRPLTDVDGFINEAKQLGCYTPGQAANSRTALGIAREGAEHAGTLAATATVGSALADLDAWFNAYGRNKRASAASVRTYKARTKKLLEDFVRWNGGDYMQWKSENEKPSTPRKSKRKRPAPQPEPQNGPPADPGFLPEGTVHELKLPGGRTASLVIPEELDKRDIEKLWKQLEPIKALLIAQAQINETDEDEQEV